MVTEVDSQPLGCWFDHLPCLGIFPEENSSNSETSIGGVHSALISTWVKTGKADLMTGLGVTSVPFAGHKEQRDGDGHRGSALYNVASHVVPARGVPCTRLSCLSLFSALTIDSLQLGHGQPTY